MIFFAWLKKIKREGGIPTPIAVYSELSPSLLEDFPKIYRYSKAGFTLASRGIRMDSAKCARLPLVGLRRTDQT